MKKLIPILLVLAFVVPAAAEQIADPNDTDYFSWDTVSFPCGTDYIHPCWSDDDDGTNGGDNDGDVAEVGLSAVTDPGIHTGHNLCIRADAGPGNGSCTCTAILDDDAFGAIGSTGTLNVTTSYSELCHELDTTEADDITSAGYAGAWSVRISCTSTGTRQCYVSKLWLEVPDAGRTRRMF